MVNYSILLIMISKNFNINISEFTMEPMPHSVIIPCGQIFIIRLNFQHSSVSF
jgi:hypothetical protein